MIGEVLTAPFPRNLSDVLNRAKQVCKDGLKATGVFVMPQSYNMLAAISMQGTHQLAQSILLCNHKVIKNRFGCQVSDISRNNINLTDPEEACKIAVELIVTKKADFLVKGSGVGSSQLLKAMLRGGLRDGEQLFSHVALIQNPEVDHVYAITDGGVNTFPNIEDRKVIIRNAIEAMIAIGSIEPKVAVISALEKVVPQISSTAEAFELAQQMAVEVGNLGGQIIGPVSYDVAISQDAARDKGVNGPCAGHANIIHVKDIDVGNPLVKEAGTGTGRSWAGAVVGAKAPCAFTSRSISDPMVVVYSVAFCLLLLAQQRTRLALEASSY